MERLDIKLLGGFEVTVDDRPVPPQAWERRRGADLVKVLALARGHRLHRERAIEALWPQLSAESGLANLHKAAHLARRGLGEGEAIVVRAGQVALAPDATIETDVGRFETTSELALYAGELLPDDRYEEWTLEPRERLRAVYLDALRASGRLVELVLEEPADEQAQRALMQRLIERGDRHAALRQFQRLRDALARAGIPPSEQTLALYRETVARRAPVAPVAAAGPIVGREAELELAREALERTADGRGGALLVSGEAGSGKTRLCEQLLCEAARGGWMTLRGACGEAEGPLPYAPIVEALDRLLLERPDLVADLSDGGRGELARLSITAPGIGPPSADAPDRQRIFSAIAQLLAAAARERGAVLLVDDLHAADEITLQLVHFLARTARFQRLLVIACLREPIRSEALTAARASLIEHGAGTELRVGALAPDHAAALVARAAPHEPTAETVAAIGRLSGGNAFFTEELAGRRRVERSARGAGATL